MPSGYLKDDGSSYDSARGYGWTTTVNTRERNYLSDQTRDTLIHFDTGTTVDWNYNLANGDYLVSLVSGDPSFPQGPHTIAIEDTTVINGVTTQANQFITLTDHPITVTDGQLTVRLTRNGGSSKTILNSLIITPVSTSASLASPGSIRQLAALRGVDSQNSSRHIHQAVMPGPNQLAPSSVMRQGGGLFSLRFGLPQLQPERANPLVHLVSHGGTPSTTISPTTNSVLPGSTVTFSWSYDGENTSGTTNVPYKYTGKEQDGSTGLYFYEARYYDPVLGQFISADTIVPSATDPQALNRYAYARNNPILYTDPSGHFFKKSHFKSIGKGLKKVDNFAWKNRHYFSGGQTLAFDYAATDPTIGPYVRGAAMAAASYYGGPLGAATVRAYLTRLDGGSISAAVKAGAITYATGAAGYSAYMTKTNGGSYGDALKAGAITVGSSAAGQAFTGIGGNYILGGAGAGALSAALNGGDVGQGALMGASNAVVMGGLSGRNVGQDLLDAAGKVWNLPNTAIGLAWGGIGVLGGAEVSIGHNAIQFTNHPLGVGAVTLGNTISYTQGSGPGDYGILYGSKVLLNIGLHEQAHTYQSQVYGPLFLPLWLLGGGPSASNPFEQSANNFALGGSW